MTSPPTSTPSASARTFPAVVSLAAGLAIFGAKLAAWQVTGSAAVLSDAMESIVNVLAAGFALFSVRFAAAPADREHPYGHGKIELVSAAFEGGLVTFAALAILVGAIQGLVFGVELRSLGLGLVVTAAAGLANLGLGAWLLRRGRALGSKALEADGKHVLSDVWTTVGVLLGLALVRLTGLTWLDPLAALLVGLLLARTGLGLVRESVDALLDATDPQLVERVLTGWAEARVPGIIDLHKVRAIKGGRDLHIDAHAHVPAHWTVEAAHEASRRFEEGLFEHLGESGELALHLDPCQRAWCHCCDLDDCPVRREPFVAYRSLSVEHLLSEGALPEGALPEGQTVAAPASPAPDATDEAQGPS